MATEESVRKNSATKTASEQLKTSRDTVVDWLSVYAQVYRETLTPELVVAYQSSLGEVRPQILHLAFLRAMKSSTFRPTPAEVLAAVAVELEYAPRPKQLELPDLSETDRGEIQTYFDALRNKLRIPARPPINEKKRRAELRRQAAEVLMRHPKPARNLAPVKQGRKQGGE